MVRHISFSEIDTYQRCNLKHHFAYTERITPVEGRVESASIGSLFHDVMAKTLYKYIDINYNRELEREVFDYVENYLNSLLTKSINPDIIQTVRDIVPRTLKEIDIIPNWRTVIDTAGMPYIEYSISYPVSDTLHFVGRIDWLAENVNSGHIYLIDWKTRKNLQSDEDDSDILHEDFNMQLPLYTYVVSKKSGKHILGNIIYQVDGRPNDTPKKLLNGSFSRANIVTTWAKYEEALLIDGKNPEDYADMRDKLNERKFTKPITLLRSASELEAFWDNAVQWMHQISSDYPIIPNIGHNCLYCPYKSLCLARLRGYDYDWILKNEFTKR